MIVLKRYFERLSRFTYSYYSLLKTNLYSLNTDDTTISTISIGIRTHIHTLKYTLHSELMQASTSVYQSIQSLFWWLLPWYQRPLISYLFWINWPFDVDSKEEFSMAVYHQSLNCNLWSHWTTGVKGVLAPLWWVSWMLCCEFVIVEQVKWCKFFWELRVSLSMSVGSVYLHDVVPW